MMSKDYDFRNEFNGLLEKKKKGMIRHGSNPCTIELATKKYLVLVYRSNFLSMP